MGEIRSLYDAIIKTKVQEDQCTYFLLYLQVLREVRCRLSVDADRTGLARAPVGFTQKIEGQVMTESGECHPRRFPRQLCYPLQSR